MTTYRYNPGLAIWTRAWLVTRYGYKIPLSNAYGIYQDGDFSGLIDWIKGINYIFRLKGKIGDTTALNKSGLNRSGEHYGPIIETEYYGDLGANKDKYTKFVNNGILYIVNEFDKVGFSILNNQQMIDEYGLSEFLSTIKQSSVKYEDLIDDNYWINAL